MDRSETIEYMESLAREKSYLSSIRSLMDDDRFRRWFAGFKKRFEGTVDHLDSVDADDVVNNAQVRGQRTVYKHEINIIEGASERIKDIDSELEILNNKINNKQKGNVVRGSAVRPKE